MSFLFFTSFCLYSKRASGFGICYFLSGKHSSRSLHKTISHIFTPFLGMHYHTTTWPVPGRVFGCIHTHRAGIRYRRLVCLFLFSSFIFFVFCPFPFWSYKKRGTRSNAHARLSPRQKLLWILDPLRLLQHSFSLLNRHREASSDDTPFGRQTPHQHTRFHYFFGCSRRWNGFIMTTFMDR